MDLLKIISNGQFANTVNIRVFILKDSEDEITRVAARCVVSSSTMSPMFSGSASVLISIRP